MHVCGCEHTCGLLSVCFEKACMCWLPWVLCGHVCMHCAHTCGAPVIRPCMPSCVWAGWAGLRLRTPSLSGTRAENRKTEAERGRPGPATVISGKHCFPLHLSLLPTSPLGFSSWGFTHLVLNN